MSVTNRSLRVVSIALAGALSAAPAIAAPPDSPIRANAQQQASLDRPSTPVRSWMASGVASSKTQLIYASLINSVSTGSTNVYEVSGTTLKLVGQLAVGGGPIAVDRNENVYVASTGANVVKWDSRNVYEFARGATKPTRILQDPDQAWDIAIAYDATVYVAGALTSPKHYGSIMRYAPGATTGTRLRPDDAPLIYGAPRGLTIDAAGDVFAGWQPVSGPPLCAEACVLELPAGSKSWHTLLAHNGPAMGLMNGPFLDGGGNLVLFTLDAQTDQQLMQTFVPGQSMPSRVASIPLMTTPAFATALDAAGTSLWGENTLFNSSIPYLIFRLDYPSGKVNLSFQIPQTTLSIPPDEGIAVSPAFYP
jgi:hypothetical protein